MKAKVLKKVVTKKATGKRKAKAKPKDSLGRIKAILAEMNEPRPLPMGRREFEEWSDRIISGALLTPGSTDDAKIFVESQKFALANMLMHLGPTESHKPDAFFIHSLRKFAVNQVADTIRKELHEAAKARTALEEAAKLEAAKTETAKTEEKEEEEKVGGFTSRLGSRELEYHRF